MRYPTLNQYNAWSDWFLMLDFPILQVCNHPELFERRDIKTPAHLSIEPYILPKLIYREGILNTCIPSKQHILYRLLYIHNTEHVHNATTNTEHRTTTQSQQSHSK